MKRPSSYWNSVHASILYCITIGFQYLCSNFKIQSLSVMHWIILEWSVLYFFINMIGRCMGSTRNFLSVISDGIFCM